MNIDEVLKIGTAILASLGGSALILAAFSNWLAGIWAKRMLQNERAEHSEKLEELKQQLNLIKDIDLTRHHDKLSTYRDVIHLVSEILQELERIIIKKEGSINEDVERKFSLNRVKSYGYLSLVSNQEVMDRYNDLIDFFIPIIYEGRSGLWKEMRAKADLMLNAMRKDLGITEGEIFYQGER